MKILITLLCANNALNDEKLRYIRNDFVTEYIHISLLNIIKDQEIDTFHFIIFLPTDFQVCN